MERKTNTASILTDFRYNDTLFSAINLDTFQSNSMDIIESLQWRYATKKFAPNKSVSSEDLETILEAGNLAATSYGLQPVEFVVVSDPALRQRLVPFSYNQPQVGQAPHVIVIAVRTDVDADFIRASAKLTEQVRGLEDGQLDDYAKQMIGAITSMDDDQRLVWAQKQSYIVLSNLMTACAALKIDSCPMEGFVPAEYNRLLDLESKNLHASVVLPVGYRAEDDEQQGFAKVRKPLKELTHYV